MTETVRGSLPDNEEGRGGIGDGAGLPSPHEPSPGLLTPGRLAAACAFWQGVLRLQDWNIGLRIVRQSEVREMVRGRVEAGQRKREALIRIVELADVVPNDWPELPSDWERTLVHELLHLCLWHVDTPAEGPRCDAEERAVDALSGTLVKLTRAPLDGIA